MHQLKKAKMSIPSLKILHQRSGTFLLENDLYSIFPTTGFDILQYECTIYPLLGDPNELGIRWKELNFLRVNLL